MSFASPTAFAWLALAVPIVLLYIMKVRLRRVPVSTNMFWGQIYDEKPPRSLWHQLRHLNSLLLQLLLLLLIVLAIVDPVWTGQTRRARQIVLVIDNSASMQVADVSPSRLDAAKSAAISLIDSLGFRDQAAVIVAGRSPRVICGMSGHLPTLKAAVQSVEFSDGSTELSSSIRLAQRLIDSQQTGSIFVFTDGCVHESEAEFVASFSTTKASLKSGGTVNASQTDASQTETAEWADAAAAQKQPVVLLQLFGGDSANLGITQFQVRRSLSDPLGYEILVAVHNASDEDARCRLELTLDDITIDLIPLTLKAGETWMRSIEKTSQDGGILKAMLSGFSLASTTETSVPETATKTLQDFLESDNRSFAILPGRKIQQVLLVSDGNLFLEKVLEANPLVSVLKLSEVPENIPDVFSSQDGAIVFHGKVPSVLPAGNVVVIDPTNDSDHWALGETALNPLISFQDEASSLMTFVQLANVAVPQARTIKFSSPVHALVKSISEDVLYAEIKRPNGRCLVLSLNLESSDLAFRTSFPILISNALNWFSGASAEWQPAVTPDDTMTVQLPWQVTTKASLLSPRGDRRIITPLLTSSIDGGDDDGGDGGASEPEVAVGPFEVTGLWRIQQGSADAPVGNSAGKSDPEGSIQIAVNLADERESDLRPNATLKSLQSDNDSLAASGFSRPLWMTLILLGCILTCVEWFLYHRRLIE